MGVPDHLAINGMDHQSIPASGSTGQTTHIECPSTRTGLDMVAWRKRWRTRRRYNLGRPYCTVLADLFIVAHKCSRRISRTIGPPLGDWTMVG